MRRYDVIIIGLGPGGASAAVDLSDDGAKVLVMDGSGSESKACGGCISLRGVRSLQSYDPPPWLYDFPVSSLWLTGPGHNPGYYTTDAPGCYFIERKKLDGFFARRAANAGAEIIQSKVRFVVDQGSHFEVACSEGVFKSTWLLGAEGTNSIVGRAFDLGQTNHEFVALVENRPMPKHLAKLLDSAAIVELGGIRGGYGWLFGRGDMLNMGMAGLRKTLGVSGGLKLAYRRFLARHGLVNDGSPRGAVIPCPGLRRICRSRGRVAVVGDAAALADPFLGEGIAPAIVSGRQAAAAIIAGNLGKYEHRLAETLLRDHYHAGYIARLVYGWPGLALTLARKHPGGINLGWRLLRGEIVPANLWAEVFKGFCGLPHNLDPRASAYYS